MHSFGNSFGFRRSNEHLFSGPESGRVPADAEWLQGYWVELTTASGGSGKQELDIAGAESVGIPGFRGLLVQYERFPTANNIDTFPVVVTRQLSKVVPGRLANVVTGAGIKVWFKNLDADDREGHISFDAEERVDATDLLTIGVGDYLKWDGTDKFEATSDVTKAAMVVTRVTATGVEATLLA